MKAQWQDHAETKEFLCGNFVRRLISLRLMKNVLNPHFLFLCERPPQLSIVLILLFTVC